MVDVLGVYEGVLFERDPDKKWLPLTKQFLVIQLVKIKNKYEQVYRVWAYEDEQLEIEMRVLASLKVAKQETFLKLTDDEYNETIGIRFKTNYMSNQFFEDVRDVIRVAPAKEIVDLPEDHDIRKALPEETVKLRVHLPVNKKGKERKCFVLVDKRTTMGQLLAAIRKNPKIKNPNAWIELRANRYNLSPPHFTVSSTVGNLGIREIFVVHNRGPHIPAAMKVKCHLPVGHKIALEVSPRITLKEMFMFICRKYQLDKMMHNIVSKKKKSQILDMTLTVSASEITEFAIMRQKYPVKAHEYWDDDKEWLLCEDCEFEGLPYSKEWVQKIKTKPTRLDKLIEEYGSSDEDDEPAYNNQNLIKHIPKDEDNDHNSAVNNITENDWKPPKGNLKYEEAKSKFQRYRNPLCGTNQATGKEIYPDLLPEDDNIKSDAATSKQDEHKSEPESNYKPAQSDTEQSNSIPLALPNGYHTQYPYPHNPLFNNILPHGYGPWGNPVPMPFYPFPPQNPYNFTQSTMPPFQPRPNQNIQQEQPQTQEKQSIPQEHNKDESFTDSGRLMQESFVNFDKLGDKIATSDPSADHPDINEETLSNRRSFGKSYKAPTPPTTSEEKYIEPEKNITSKNPETSLISETERRRSEKLPVDKTSRREPFKNVRAPAPPNISTRTVRKFHGPETIPSPPLADHKKVAQTLGSVRNSIRSYVKRIEKRHRMKNSNGDIPQESAMLPPVDNRTQPLTDAEYKLKQSGVLKDERQEQLPDRLSFKQKRKFVENEANNLIDGLVGAIKSGDILKNLRQDKGQPNKYEFISDGADKLVEHGSYLQRED